MISISCRHLRTIPWLLPVTVAFAACGGQTPPSAAGTQDGAPARIAGDAAHAEPAAAEPPTAVDATAPASAAPDPFWPPPLELRLALELDFEHGCSQSFETRGATAVFELEVAEDGAATMTMELDQSTVFGPSMGRFEQGDRDFHHRYWKEHTSWSGRARRQGDLIEIAFDRRRSARAEMPRYGERELPRATAGRASLRLECRPLALDVYRASTGDGFEHTVKEGEQPNREPALACKPSAELFELIEMLYVDGALPFGRGAGLAVGNWVIHSQHNLVVREGK